MFTLLIASNQILMISVTGIGNGVGVGIKNTTTTNIEIAIDSFVQGTLLPESGYIMCIGIV